MRVILSRLIQFCKLDFFFEFFYCLNVLQKFGRNLFRLKNRNYYACDSATFDSILHNYF